MDFNVPSNHIESPVSVMGTGEYLIVRKFLHFNDPSVNSHLYQ